MITSPQINEALIQKVREIRSRPGWTHPCEKVNGAHVLAMPSAYATRSTTRARAGLGHAAGIAIAGLLASCGASPKALPGSDPEVSDIAYSTMGMIAEKADPQGAYARNALADGKVRESEYSETIAIGYRLNKAKVIDQWGRNASGIEAQSDETPRAAQPVGREPVPTGDALTSSDTERNHV